MPAISNKNAFKRITLDWLTDGEDKYVPASNTP